MFFEIKGSLIYIIDWCFQTESFPKMLKIGISKPLLKKGNRQNMANSVPVFVISNIVKIGECLLQNRIMIFVDKSITWLISRS